MSIASKLRALADEIEVGNGAVESKSKAVMAEDVEKLAEDKPDRRVLIESLKRITK